MIHIIENNKITMWSNDINFNHQTKFWQFFHTFFPFNIIFTMRGG